MALFKRNRSQYYWTKFYFEGQFVQRSTKTANKKDAQKFEDAIRTQLSFGRIGIDQLAAKPNKPLTFSEAMADYLAGLEVKDSTQRRYAVASKALIAFFGKLPVTSIGTADVERFRSTRKQQNKKAPNRLLAKNTKAKDGKQIRPATVNRELTLLSGLFKSLVRSGKAHANPVTGVTFLREENTQTRVVTDQEFRAYVMAASQPLRDVAVLMFQTGLRPSEIFNLKKEDLDFENGRIRIAEGKTAAARRRLTMSDDARRVLADRYASAKGELLFAGGKKGDQDAPIVNLTNAHHAAIARAKVKTFRLYDLRHTFLTHLTQSGVDLMTVAAIAGHSRITMTQRYCHVTEQHQADAIARLESFRSWAKSNVRTFQKSA